MESITKIISEYNMPNRSKIPYATLSCHYSEDTGVEVRFNAVYMCYGFKTDSILFARGSKKLFDYLVDKLQYAAALGNIHVCSMMKTGLSIAAGVTNPFIPKPNEKGVPIWFRYTLDSMFEEAELGGSNKHMCEEMNALISDCSNTIKGHMTVTTNGFSSIDYDSRYDFIQKLQARSSCNVLSPSTEWGKIVVSPSSSSAFDGTVVIGPGIKKDYRVVRLNGEYSPVSHNLITRISPDECMDILMSGNKLDAYALVEWWSNIRNNLVSDMTREWKSVKPGMFDDSFKPFMVRPGRILI